MTKSVLDELRPEPRPKTWQKCERLSRKTDDEWFATFCNIVGLSYGTCQRILSDETNMQRIAAEFVTRLLSSDQKERRIAFCIELKEQPEKTLTLSPPSLLVANLGCLGTTLRLIGSRFSGRFQLHPDWRKYDKFGVMLNQCWFFFTLKASCIRNLIHQDRRWKENYIATFWGDWGKTSSANFQTSATKTPGSCVMTTLRLKRRSLWSSFWLLRIRKSFPTLLPTHRIWPTYDFFPIPEHEIEAQGLTFWQQSRTYRRTWWRRWRELTSRSTSDHGNPTGIAILMTKGTTWKGMEANRNFIKWLSYSKGITGTFG